MPQHQIIDKERDNSIDIARGIAILGVLYGHAMAWQDIHGTMLVHWFWSFHMALFALVSGYFYKEKSFWESFVSSVKNLLVPLFVVSFVLFFMDKIGGGINNWKSFWYDLFSRVLATLTLQVAPPGFWFVIALFNCRLILTVVSKLKIKYKFQILAVFSICVFLLPKHIDLFHISHTFGLMAFVIIGIYAKKYALLERPVKKQYAVLLAIVLLSAGLFFVDMWRYYMPLYILNFFSASIICYALVFYCKQFDQLKTNIVVPVKNLFAFCGRHSMMMLSFQAILGQWFIQSTKNLLHINNAYILMVIFVLGCIVSTFILDKIRTNCSKLVLIN